MTSVQVRKPLRRQQSIHLVEAGYTGDNGLHNRVPHNIENCRLTYWTTGGKRCPCTPLW